MDASTPEPIDDDPIAPPSPISLPLQPVHTSVHAIAPRRRASASGPRPASLQGTSGSPDTTAVSSAAVSIPNLAEPNTDSSTNSPMTAVLQGAQETLQRRASASQELDLDSSHNTRRASIRDWIQSQKDEMKEQQVWTNDAQSKCLLTKGSPARVDLANRCCAIDGSSRNGR
jgi:hypothetical protein